MFRSLLAKLFPRYRSRTKVIEELSSPVDNHEDHMDLPVCELPADQVVSDTLFLSTDAACRDQWLGEKYLECMLALTSVKSISGSDGITTLNVCLASHPVEVRVGVHK